jgi:hypothetical protein
MFGEKIDYSITMLQRIVALLRDLILGVVVLITALIVINGGDPSKLDTFDWIVLVIAAFLIVISPVLAFFVVRFIIFILFRLHNKFFPTFKIDGPIPKGLLGWMYLRSFKNAKREYIRYWRVRNQRLKRFSVRHPVLFKWMYIYPDKISNILGVFMKLVYPYMIALLALLIAIIVFRKVLYIYIP